MNKEMVPEFCRCCCDLLDQSLLKINNCLDQLTDEQTHWQPPGSSNSISVLNIHMCGNLKQWGIVPLTREADQRDRESEFQDDPTFSRLQQRNLLRETINQAKLLWMAVQPDDLLKEHVIQGFDVSLLNAILHTSTHFACHTHQIILMTRMQLGDDYQFQWSPDLPRDQLPI